MRNRGKMARTALAAAAFAAVPALALATEIVTYTYDAKGRLVKVVHSGDVNNGVTVEYKHDKADNRTKVKVTGSSNPPSPP